MSIARTCLSCRAELPADSVLDVCPRCVALQVLASTNPAPEALSSVHPGQERPGAWVGRYKILQKIGEGGCGVVYVAEQEQPVRRRVALKIIKPGMDTRQVVARFEAERQALALMDHPNIAKVHDGGATESGRPYFVMELVRGLRITDYCDEANLSTTQRLDLFTQVCRAVQHAHQKGVIHRDLKPSNILVTINDGEAVPKVIDFGIAKAMAGQPLTDKTVFTAFEQFIGTPAYMSPEQALMTSLDIDTRSDIYSLGVLLYELLTGRTPLDPGEMMAAGLDAMRRTIREKEPARPSARLSTLAEGDLTTAAKRRGTDAPRLIHALRGDLDWIVMKCLEKDRSRRYETANGLAADILRHLNNEPIVARPPSAAYRFRKAFRRNQIAFAAAGAVAAALMIGLGVSLWQVVENGRAYRRAVAAETAARIEATKSRQVADLFKKMFGGMRHAVALGRDTTVLREIAEKTLMELDQNPDLPPEVGAELRACMAMIFHQTGQYIRAEALYRETLPRMRLLMGEQSLNVTAALRDFACVLQHVGKPDEAEAAAREALKRSREIEGPASTAVADSLDMLSLAFLSQNRLAEAEDLARQSLAIHQKTFGPDDWNTATATAYYAKLLGKLGRHSDAEPLFRQALATMRTLFPEVHPAVASVLEDYANDLFEQRRLAEASELYRQLLPIQRKLFGTEHQVANTLLNLSATLIDGGHPVEGEPFARECLAIRQKLLGTDHVLSAEPMNNVAVACWRLKRLTEAERLFRDVLAIRQRVAPDDYSQQATTRYNLGRLLVEQQRSGEADELFMDASRMATTEKDKALLLQQRAELRARAGRWADAAADLARAIELGPEDHVRYHELAPLLVQTANLDAYRKHCAKEVAQFREINDPHIAERMAKDCLIHPDSGVDREVIATWTDLAVTAGKDSDDLPWFQSAKALGEYRRAHFAEAAEWARRALEKPGDEHRDPQASSIMAMAQHRLGQTDAARVTLVKALELGARLPTLEGGDIGDGWLDWIIAHTLLREAKELIEGDTRPAGLTEDALSTLQKARP